MFCASHNYKEAYQQPTGIVPRINFDKMAERSQFADPLFTQKLSVNPPSLQELTFQRSLLAMKVDIPAAYLPTKRYYGTFARSVGHNMMYINQKPKSTPAMG